MCIPLDECCFCVSLDVGAKIISIINLAGSTMIVMVYGVAASLPPPVEESRKIVYAIIASVAMFKFLIGCVLVYGVFGKRPSLILPWLIACCVLVTSLLALSVVGTVLVVLRYAEAQNRTEEVTTMVAVYVIMAALLYFFGCVISSRRNEILEGTYVKSAVGLMTEYRL